MNTLAAIGLSVGLAMDAAAVSVTRGFSTERLRIDRVLGTALLFGFFQGFMAMCGWLLGEQLGTTMKAWDHWVAFVLLTGIGAHMIAASRGSNKDEDDRSGRPRLGVPVLILLAFATSIDAFAAGITLPTLQSPILFTLISIAAVTTLLSSICFWVGHHFGSGKGDQLEAFGGVVLICLGTLILAQHLGQPSRLS